MALGRRGGERQGEMWVATGESPRAPRHVFYQKLNGVLKAAGFYGFVEELCEEYYAANGRPSIPPGVFLRMRAAPPTNRPCSSGSCSGWNPEIGQDQVP